MLNIPNELRSCKNTQMTDELAKSLGLTFVGSGGTRKTYMHKSGAFVVKVERYQNGCNRSEVSTYKLHMAGQIGTPLAECELLDNGWLVMEAVDVIVDSDWNQTQFWPKDGNLPAWVYSLDSKQAGYTRSEPRRLVAFDYPNGYY